MQPAVASPKWDCNASRLQLVAVRRPGTPRDVRTYLTAFLLVLTAGKESMQKVTVEAMISAKMTSAMIRACDARGEVLPRGTVDTLRKADRTSLERSVDYRNSM